MEVNVQLRVHTSHENNQYEWQVVHDGLVYYRSEFRADCVDWLRFDSNKDIDFTLKRVQVNVRPRLSAYAKAAMSLIVEKHGRDQKIACIKEVRAVYGIGLKEAKELVEDYLERN